jgi:predicted house-cleaning noncanonical NTP pyrophosphatase (MazG superfamily)
MPRKHFNKLVRDRIPEIIENDNRQYATRVLSDIEFEQALRAKVIEEATEVTEASPEELVKEVADLLEVIETLIAFHGIEMETVVAKKAERRKSRGGFENHILLMWADTLE